MSIIEQATRRLEELQRAGVEIPWAAVGAAASPAAIGMPPAPAATPLVTPERPSPEAPAAQNQRPPAKTSRTVKVDTPRLLEAGYLVPGRERTRWADEFRAIKRPLLSNVQSPPGDVSRPNLIMVTSAMPAEGKTFCAVNLALSIASEIDSSVLLVDADVLRPAVLNRLGIDGQFRGLLDVLDGEVADVADVMLKTDVPKLTVVPAGAPRRHATELLTSSAMENLLQDIATRYSDRIVVFDAPPILLTSESKALAAQMGQIVMVVQEAGTSTPELNAAYSALESVPLVFSVLNQASTVPAQGYGSGYGYYE